MAIGNGRKVEPAVVHDQRRRGERPEADEGRVTEGDQARVADDEVHPEDGDRQIQRPVHPANLNSPETAVRMYGRAMAINVPGRNEVGPVLGASLHHGQHRFLAARSEGDDRPDHNRDHQ